MIADDLLFLNVDFLDLMNLYLQELYAHAINKTHWSCNINLIHLKIHSFQIILMYLQILYQT